MRCVDRGPTASQTCLQGIEKDDIVLAGAVWRSVLLHEKPELGQ